MGFAWTILDANHANARITDGSPLNMMPAQSLSLNRF
jgi:hypothetical protein